MTQAAIELNKRLVLLSLEAIQAWEAYSSTIQGPERALNDSLLRLLKGCVKAWRFWLLEAHPQQLPQLVLRSSNHSKRIAAGESNG